MNGVMRDRIPALAADPVESDAHNGGRSSYVPRMDSWSSYMAQARRVAPRRRVLGFMIIQLAAQLAVLIPALAPARFAFRVLSFLPSILLLVARLLARDTWHPAAKPAGAVVLILLLALLHPSSNTALASVGQTGLYLSVLAPLVWVGDGVSIRDLRTIALVIWAFSVASATVGVLQTYYPGQFQPQVSSIIVNQGSYLSGLDITLASGRQMLRPMGLTDTPGGAAISGLYAIVLGIPGWLSTRNRTFRVFAAAGFAVGVFVIYLSQVRVMFVMAAICFGIACFALTRRGEARRLTSLVVVLGSTAIASTLWALSVGGKAVAARFSTLYAHGFDEAYSTNRGGFLRYTLDVLLPQYPFGAGIGRWGMMHHYFGDSGLPGSEPIYVEIQWTGWLLDGGLPLVLANIATLAVAVVVAWHIAVRTRDSELAVWATAVLGFTVACVASTFNSPTFVTQVGLQCWLLNACLFSAWRYQRTTAGTDL